MSIFIHLHRLRARHPNLHRLKLPSATIVPKSKFLYPSLLLFHCLDLSVCRSFSMSLFRSGTYSFAQGPTQCSIVPKPKLKSKSYDSIPVDLSPPTIAFSCCRFFIDSDSFPFAAFVTSLVSSLIFVVIDSNPRSRSGSYCILCNLHPGSGYCPLVSLSFRSYLIVSLILSVCHVGQGPTRSCCCHT